MSQQGDELRRQLYREELRVRTELAIEIATNVDIAMPGDTGWARANTVLSLGEPVPGPIGAPGEVSAADAAADAGFAAVVANTDPTVDICVANRAPYIDRLNAGWSPQAQAGFLDRVVDDAVQTVQAREDAKTVPL